MKVYGKSRSDVSNAFSRGDISVSVFGLGKIGLPLASVLASKGAKVTGVDVSEKIVDSVNAGECHITGEPGLKELVFDMASGGRLRATTDGAAASAGTDVKVIIVPLFVNEKNEPDASAVKAAALSVSEGLKKGDLVILETTSPVGTTDGLLREALESSGLKAGSDFGIAHCPERVFSGRAIRDIKDAYPKIIGGIDEQSSEAAVGIYEVVCSKGVLVVSDAKTAEAVKIFEGLYRDVNIALANEIAIFSREIGIDAMEAIDAANTQPYSNIHRPGAGVGGHCIPIYPHFIIQNVKSGTDVIQNARRMNDSMPGYTVKLVEEGLKNAGREVKGAKVMVLGLAFRGGVKETRKAPAVPIFRDLESKGADVCIYDPLFSPKEVEALGLKFGEGFDGLDAVVIVTEHQEFLELDWKSICGKMRTPIVIDGRQMLKPFEMESLGFQYLGIGH